MKLLVGSAAALGPGCSGGERSRQQAPLFTADSSNDSSSSETAPFPPLSSDTAAPSSDVTPPIPTSGYLVVDMLPEPTRCATTGAAIVKTTASAVTRPGGKLGVVLKIEAPPAPMSFQADGVRGDGAIGERPEVVPNGRGLIVKGAITGEEAGLRVYIPLVCGTDRGMVAIYVHWEAGKLVSGATLPVEISALR